MALRECSFKDGIIKIKIKSKKIDSIHIFISAESERMMVIDQKLPLHNTNSIGIRENVGEVGSVYYAREAGTDVKCTHWVVVEWRRLKPNPVVVWV